MIRYASTRKLLQKLDKLYREHSTSDLSLPIAYSKLANLEVCGWLEEAFDEVAHNCVRNKLKSLEDRRLLIKKIEATHGFDYATHTRPLLIFALGVVKLIEVEKKLASDGSLDRLNGAIGSLKPVRRDAAHTSIAGTTESYPAPSVAIQRFETCLPIVQNLWRLVRA